MPGLAWVEKGNPAQGMIVYHYPSVTPAIESISSWHSCILSLFHLCFEHCRLTRFVLKTSQAFSSSNYALGMVLPYQVAQIFDDIVDQGYYLPPLAEDEIIDTGVLAVKDIMIGDRDSANTPRCYLGGWG